jgi:hypothetical protein
MNQVKLREIGHSRAGDKGNTSSVSFFVYDSEHYEAVGAQLTAERVKLWFGDVVGDVRRYDVPSLGGFNFVMTDTLAGGVTTSLALDVHGKSRSSYFLEQEIEIERFSPQQLLPQPDLLPHALILRD